ncbi:hypothetical protein KCU88_g81, partial [Aureobasidium melanogenum]
MLRRIGRWMRRLIELNATLVPDHATGVGDRGDAGTACSSGHRAPLTTLYNGTIVQAIRGATGPAGIEIQDANKARAPTAPEIAQKGGLAGQTPGATVEAWVRRFMVSGEKRRRRGVEGTPTLATDQCSKGESRELHVSVGHRCLWERDTLRITYLLLPSDVMSMATLLGDVELACCSVENYYLSSPIVIGQLQFLLLYQSVKITVCPSLLHCTRSTEPTSSSKRNQGPRHDTVQLLYLNHLTPSTRLRFLNAVNRTLLRQLALPKGSKTRMLRNLTGPDENGLAASCLLSTQDPVPIAMSLPTSPSFCSVSIEDKILIEIRDMNNIHVSLVRLLRCAHQQVQLPILHLHQLNSYHSMVPGSLSTWSAYCLPTLRTDSLQTHYLFCVLLPLPANMHYLSIGWVTSGRYSCSGQRPWAMRVLTQHMEAGMSVIAACCLKPSDKTILTRRRCPVPGFSLKRLFRQADQHAPWLERSDEKRAGALNYALNRGHRLRVGLYQQLTLSTTHLDGLLVRAAAFWGRR